MWTRLRVWWWRLRELGARRHGEARLAEEVHAHLDHLVEHYLTKGLSPHEARVAAQREFGGIAAMADAHRDERRLPILDALALDLRFGLRLLARDTRFAAAVILVLGLGIGVNNMLFTILYAHTLRGLPIAQSERVLFISSIDDKGAMRGVSLPDFEDFAARARTVEPLAAFTTAPALVGDAGRAPDRLDGAVVTATALALFDIQPLRGRRFTADDERPGAPAVAMLTQAAWHSRYGGDAGIVGRNIFVDGAPTLVVGIVPDRAALPSVGQVWLPLTRRPPSPARDDRRWSVAGRVRDGVEVAAAAAEIETIASDLEREHPTVNRHVRAHVVPIDDHYFGRLSNPAWRAFMAVGVLVVLISCANVANLLLARAVQRTGEMAIRLSLGASRGRVVRQLLIESFILAMLGGAAGLMVSAWGVRAFRGLMPDDALPHWFDYAIDARVLAVLVGVSLATVIVFGLAPALTASKADVNHVLKTSGGWTHTHRARRWTTLFLTGELALTMVMLCALVVGLRSAKPTPPAEAALETSEILTAVLDLPEKAYPTAELRADLVRRLGERLTATPGIVSTSVTSTLPLHGAERRRLAVDGRPTRDGEPPTVATVGIGSRYFATLGVPLVRGREQDRGTGAAREVLVNQPFVDLYLAGVDPIGQRLALGAPDGRPDTSTWLTVVGVAPTVRQGRGPVPEPVVYTAWQSAPSPTATLIVRGSLETVAVATRLRTEMAALDASVPVYRVKTMQAALDDVQWNGRVSSTLFNVLAGLAIALCAVGLYAVTTHAVNVRAHEIALRLALGARRGHVMAMVLRRVLFHLMLGFAAGLGCTLAWSRLFASGRADVSTTDPTTLALAAVALAGLALLATVAPLRRALQVDPLTAMRG